MAQVSKQASAHGYARPDPLLTIEKESRRSSLTVSVSAAAAAAFLCAPRRFLLLVASSPPFRYADNLRRYNQADVRPAAATNNQLHPHFPEGENGRHERRGGMGRRRKEAKLGTLQLHFCGRPLRQIGPGRFVHNLRARAQIDRRLAGSLTVISVGVGGEEDAESGLVGDGAAAGVGAARVDAVRQHQRARLRVEHVGGARVDVA